VQLRIGYCQVQICMLSRLTASPTRARSCFGKHGGSGLARIKFGRRVRSALVVCHGWRMTSPTCSGLASAGWGSIPRSDRGRRGEVPVVLQCYVMAANASPTHRRLCPGRPCGTVSPGQAGSSLDRASGTRSTHSRVWLASSAKWGVHILHMALESLVTVDLWAGPG
jgi:hypothetical protein